MDVSFYFCLIQNNSYGGKIMKMKKWLVILIAVNLMLLGYIFVPKNKDYDQKLMDSAAMVNPITSSCVPTVKITAAQTTEKSLNKLGLSLSNSFSVGIKK